MTAAYRTLALALTLFATLLWAAYPGESSHTTSHRTFDSVPVNVRNETFQDLTIRNAPNVTLVNVTVNGYLRIEYSYVVRFDHVFVASTFEFLSSTDAKLRDLNVTGYAKLSSAQRVHLDRDFFSGDVALFDSQEIEFDRTTVKGCVYLQNSSYRAEGPPLPNNCPTETPSPTTYSTPPTAATYTESPPPTASEPPHTETTYPTYSYPPPKTTYYYSPTYTPPPTYAPPPTSAPPPNRNYHFELLGKTVYQDVWISSADSVSVRNSTIHGNLGIGWSTNVALENLQVTGRIHIDQSSSIEARNLEVGQMFGLSYGTTFVVAQSRVGGDLGCYRCSHGSFEDLDVGGRVQIFESQNVGQSNVRSRNEETPSPPYPPPTTRPAEAGNLTLNVTNSSLAFVHRKEISPRLATEVELDVNALQARARLEVPLPKAADAKPAPEQIAIRLESHFEKLLEFEDRDGNDAYDLGDLVVREYLIDDLPIASIRQERLAGGEEGWVGRIDYELPNRGLLSLVFTARDESADKTKIDVEITEYAYNAPRSQLALQVRLASASEWEIEEGGADEDQLTFHGRGFDGFFGWIRTAEADGRTTPVTARVLEEHRTASGEREVVLYLGYARARNLVHDPSIGLIEAENLAEIVAPHLGNLLVYGSTLVAVLVFLWALAQGGRRTVPPKH